jgi:hypothetical protein
VNRIQMQLMKVISNWKNIMLEEFQHYMECQLTEVTNLKTHKIQFISIVNLIQMKLMKVIDKRISSLFAWSVSRSWMPNHCFFGSSCYLVPKCHFKIACDSKKADIQSLSIILFAMATSIYPWPITNSPDPAWTLRIPQLAVAWMPLARRWNPLSESEMAGWRCRSEMTHRSIATAFDSTSVMKAALSLNLLVTNLMTDLILCALFWALGPFMGWICVINLSRTSLQ